MALHYRTCGFVIKKSDAGETDRIFTVLTKDFGKIKIFGKAIRKITSKLRGGIDLIGFSEIEFIQGKTQKTLTDAELLNCFGNVKCDLSKLKVAHRIADIINGLVLQEEKDGEVYDLLKYSFDKLNELGLTPVQVQMMYFYFIWNLFNLLGYKPEVNKCVVCQNKLSPDIIYFSPDGAGLVCGNCLKNVGFFKRVNTDIVKVLRLILGKDIKTLLKVKIPISSGRFLREISNDYYFHLLSIHLSSEDLKRERILVQ